MAEKPPFVEDGSQFGLSKTGFRRLKTAEKRELMIQWFGQHFEDPAQNTSFDSGEGGYLWNHGGPYDAREELYSKFEGVASERLLEEVAEEVEREGITEWAAVGSPEDWEDIDWSEQYDEPQSLDIYKDERTSRYGSAEELEARTKATKALANLENSLQRRQTIGIGHNQPPGESFHVTYEMSAMRRTN